jgi:two-component system NtrC family sensor kinase
MRTITLKQRILFAFAGVIIFLSVCILGLGYYVLNKDIFGRAQVRVGRSLDSARTFYEEEINRIGESLSIANLETDSAELKETLRVDYYGKVSVEEARQSASEIVRSAVEQAKPLGGTRIIDEAELEAMNGLIRKRTAIRIEKTPKARPTNRTVLESVMSKEFALPIYDDAGQIQAVAYAGRIVNRDYVLVDRIRKLVFGDELYHNKPVGTVTIFQDDVRISTNVLNEAGQRAVGTRVSEEVYDAVVENGQRWMDRAFVVTHWYKTAYEPIRNIRGEIVGILYVGILEAPYRDMTTRILAVFVTVILLASTIAFLLAYILSRSISHPLTLLTEGTRKVADGELGHLIWPAPTNMVEMQTLAKAFNDMSVRLEERDVRLQTGTAKLEELNKSYLDLLGFVAHELKGLLSSAVINAYSLRDGFLGMINFKQKKAVDSICRNLDYLDATVKKFLNLSRIERGNLEINKTEFSIGQDVFGYSVQTFVQMMNAKHMRIENRIDPQLKIKADMDLMQIVANNLVNNAIKYGREGGYICISARDKGGFVTIEVYNDSTPIPPEQIGRLFKKFSRLDTPEKKKVKGTGLGLYITKQIVEAHGGSIHVEAKDNGNSFIFTIHKE